MRWEDIKDRFPDFDTSDVDRWIGVPLGGAHMRDDVHVRGVEVGKAVLDVLPPHAGTSRPWGS